VNCFDLCRCPDPYEEAAVKTHLSAALCVAFVVVLMPTKADEPKADKDQPLHDISMEVQALRVFDNLYLTDEQIGLLAKLSKETAEPPRKRSQPKASEEYQRLLKEVRSALLAQDEDKVGELDEEIEQLQKKESPELDDGFSATKTARQRAPEVFKTFKPAQLAMYYGSVADDMHEPLLLLTEALQSVRGLEKDEWRGKRDEIADEVAWLTVGPELEKWERVSDRTVSLLSKARSLTDADFKAQRADLEKAAKDIVGTVGPDIVLRHFVEWTLSDLLSNPRLEAAAKARLK
jgi:hypothetical protein